MKRITLVVLVIALGIARGAGVAQAQPIASEPAAQPAPVATVAVIATEPVRADAPAPEFGMSAAFGWGGQKDGKEGWAARLEYQFSLTKQKPGLVVGYAGGIEAWRSGPDNWGFSFPLALALGLHAGPFAAKVGGGFDYFLVDQVEDDTGVGLFAPFALARVGVEVLGVEIGADVRYGYHWQFSAPDAARWSLTFFVGGSAPMRAK